MTEIMVRHNLCKGDVTTTHLGWNVSAWTQAHAGGNELITEELEELGGADEVAERVEELVDEAV